MGLHWFRPPDTPVIKNPGILLKLVSGVTHESGERYRLRKEKKDSTYMKTRFGNEQ